jgi:cyanate lyase
MMMRRGLIRYSYSLEHLVSNAAGHRAIERANRVRRASGVPGGRVEESGVGAAVRRLMAAKAVSGKSFSDVAAETGLTNVYVAQLLRRQAQLKPDTAAKLRAALPALTDDLVDLMMQPPFRSYHPDIIQEPAIYRCGRAKNPPSYSSA